MDFGIGVSVFVIFESGYEFSTAWGCKGCKISVVLVPTGGAILRKLSRTFLVSENLTKWKELRPCILIFC